MNSSPVRIEGEHFGIAQGNGMWWESEKGIRDSSCVQIDMYYGGGKFTNYEFWVERPKRDDFLVRHIRKEWPLLARWNNNCTQRQYRMVTDSGDLVMVPKTKIEKVVQDYRRKA